MSTVGTVAILAQGTSRADAVAQAFLSDTVMLRAAKPRELRAASPSELRAGELRAARPGELRVAGSESYGWPPQDRHTAKKLFTLLDLCVSSLRRGHANLLCIVPILTDDPRRESKPQTAK